jgi:hypothetical protein
LEALISPTALFRMRASTAAWLAAYLIACVAVLGGTAALLIGYEGHLREALLDYVFPDSWQAPASWVFERLFATQQKAVLINALASGSIVLASILLFWLKEIVSTSYETRNNLGSRPPNDANDANEHPLWEQAWEEIKLFAAYLAAQGTIFWLGYPPDAVLRGVALTLSYGFLFAMFAVDFLSPVMQRHGGHYSRILKTLLRHPVSSLTFGALFSLPPILAGRLWEANPEWTTATAVAVLFSASIIAIAWAAVSGTWLGSKMLPSMLQMPRSAGISRTAAWAALIAVLGANVYAFSTVGLSIHHKSQLLKLNYDVDLTSLSMDTPRLRDVLGRRASGALVFDVEVHNPTAFDVEIEENRIEVTHAGQPVAETALPRLSVRSGESTKTSVRVPLSLALNRTTLAKGLDLLDPSSYRVTLYLQVAPHFELPVYLIE